MIETAIPLTLHLAVLIGLYELAAGIVSLSGRMDWTAMLDEFERSPGLTFVTGFVCFAIGGAMILGHNHWTDPLAVIVSLVGWIVTAEGLLIMAFPVQIGVDPSGPLASSFSLSTRINEFTGTLVFRSWVDMVFPSLASSAVIPL